MFNQDIFRKGEKRSAPLSAWQLSTWRFTWLISWGILQIATWFCKCHSNKYTAAVYMSGECEFKQTNSWNKKKQMGTPKGIYKWYQQNKRFWNQLTAGASHGWELPSFPIASKEHSLVNTIGTFKKPIKVAWHFVHQTCVERTSLVLRWEVVIWCRQVRNCEGLRFMDGFERGKGKRKQMQLMLMTSKTLM